MHRKLIVLVLALAAAATAFPGDKFTDWSAPMNLGPPVNTTEEEFAPFISKDGLSLYFSKGRPAQSTIDIWVSQRASINDPWGPPQNVGANVNSAGNESAPTLSLDEHSLYFSSNRAGGFGNDDIYVSRRQDKRDNLGWEPAVNLGNAINSTANDVKSTFYEDEATGIITMYFESDRPGEGDFDIYASTLLVDDIFSSAMLVEDLSTSFRERQPAVRRDGLEIIFGSNRPGTGRVGGLDLMVSTRSSTSEPWSEPVYLGPVVNSAFTDGAPALSFDGTALYFHSTANRPDATGPCLPNLGLCAFDLYVTTRSKVQEGDAQDQ